MYNLIPKMYMAEEVKTDKVEKPEELDHWKKQLQVLGEELKKRDAELKKIKEEQELAKLTDEQKRVKEVDDTKKIVHSLTHELEVAKKKNADLNIIATLVAEHDLASPVLGDTLLSKYDGAEPLETFAAKMKKDPVFSRFFKTASAVTDTTNVDAPAAPSTVHSKTTVKKAGDLITDADKAFAYQMWPNREDMQKVYLEQLKKERAAV